MRVTCARPSPRRPSRCASGRRRDGLITALRRAGLNVSAFYSRDGDEVLVKVGADSEKLRALAEQSRYKLQMKDEFFGAYAEYRTDFKGTPPDYVDRKIVNSIYKQHIPAGGYPDDDSIFRTVDRVHLLNYAIRSKDRGCAGLEIGELMFKGVIKPDGYYPLHEALEVRDLEENLLDAFVVGNKIDQVQGYFGEKVAFYFLWMQFFNKHLIFGAIGSTLFICKNMWSWTPDNVATPFFALFVCCWCASFMHTWRRRSATAALQWGTLDSLEVEEVRPEFHGVRRVSPLTSQPELFYPASQRLWRMLTSYGVLAATMVAMFAAIFVLFAMRHLATRDASAKFSTRMYWMALTSLFIEVANMIFLKLARALNDWENHRTQSDYEGHLLAKTFLFKVISTYFPLIYIGFFKNNSHLFGFWAMDCFGNDCMIDLSCQLAMFFLVRLVFGNFVEYVWPQITLLYKNYVDFRTLQEVKAGAVTDMSSAEQQAKKDVWDPFDDLDEMLTTYGLTVLFWSACPWVPFVTLATNVVEIAGDANKLLRQIKRPLPLRLKDNEPWDSAFALLTHGAVFTNLGLIVWTSHQVDVPTRYKLLTFFLLQHVYLIFMWFLRKIYPEVPVEVRHLNLKHHLIVKKHLDCVDDEDTTQNFHGALQSGTNASGVWILDRDDEDDDVLPPTKLLPDLLNALAFWK